MLVYYRKNRRIKEPVLDVYYQINSCADDVVIVKTKYRTRKFFVTGCHFTLWNKALVLHNAQEVLVEV